MLEYRGRREAMIETYKMLKLVYDASVYGEMFELGEMEHGGNSVQI